MGYTTDGRRVRAEDRTPGVPSFRPDIAALWRSARRSKRPGWDPPAPTRLRRCRRDRKAWRRRARNRSAAWRSAPRGVSESFAVPEIHGHVSNAHFCAGTLGAEADGNSFVGLDVQNQTIGFHLPLSKHDVRGAVELNHDFGAAFGEALARADIKRNAGPAPIVDEQFSGDKSFRFRSSVYAGLIAVARDRFVANFSRRILSPNDGLRDHFEIERANGLQHFQFFISHCGGVEGGGRFHGN